MKSLVAALVLLGSAGVAQAQAPQQQDSPQLTRKPEWIPPETRRTAKPKKAPPGKLCLIETLSSCEGKTELIQKPYRGGGDFYYAIPKRKSGEPSSAFTGNPPHN